jgi:phosphoribosylglycinamide formyltransferase-1
MERVIDSTSAAEFIMNLAFFASHQGSNMQAVIDACQSGRLHARVCAVISNNSRSEALARAKQAGIPAYHLRSQTHPDPDQLDQATLRVLQDHGTDLIILAGYMKKLGRLTLADYPGRILNIHPALLPKFGGQGLYGRAVHEAVLKAGEVETGVTIHLVDEEYDHGRIVAQCRMPVLETDTVDTLAERVLQKEHEFLVETLRQIIDGGIRLPRVPSEEKDRIRRPGIA